MSTAVQILARLNRPNRGVRRSFHVDIEQEEELCEVVAMKDKMERTTMIAKVDGGCYTMTTAERRRG